MSEVIKELKELGIVIALLVLALHVLVGDLNELGEVYNEVLLDFLCGVTESDKPSDRWDGICDPALPKPSNDYTTLPEEQALTEVATHDGEGVAACSGGEGEASRTHEGQTANPGRHSGAVEGRRVVK